MFSLPIFLLEIFFLIPFIIHFIVLSPISFLLQIIDVNFHRIANLKQSFRLISSFTFWNYPFILYFATHRLLNILLCHNQVLTIWQRKMNYLFCFVSCVGNFEFGSLYIFFKRVNDYRLILLYPLTLVTANLFS